MAASVLTISYSPTHWEDLSANLSYTIAIVKKNMANFHRHIFPKPHLTSTVYHQYFNARLGLVTTLGYLPSGTSAFDLTGPQGMILSSVKYSICSYVYSSYKSATIKWHFSTVFSIIMFF